MSRASLLWALSATCTAASGLLFCTAVSDGATSLGWPHGETRQWTKLQATAAGVRTERASLGPVSAEVSYVENATYGHENLRLSIRHDSALIVNNIAIAPPCSSYCVAQPGRGYASPDRTVAVVDLDRNAEPEVIVNVWSGGAHCCLWAYVYRYVGAVARYEVAMHDFADFGYRLTDPNGDRKLDFVSDDYRFAYAFTSFAESAFPIQIWAYSGGSFLDETRKFPALIRNDTRRQLRNYRRNRRHGDVRGILAAYAADECLLRHCKKAFAFVERALRRQDVERHEYSSTPAGRRYVRALRRFLKRMGYI